MAENFNGLRIELRPHIGVMGSPLGPVQVEHDQWLVIGHTANAKPIHLGYLPKREGAKVLYLSGIRDELPPVFVGEIQRQAEEAASKLRLGVVEEVEASDGT